MAEYELHAGVEVRTLAGRGRGLVTTTGVPAGTVVLTERAVASIKVGAELEAAPAITQTAALAAAIITAGPAAVAAWYATQEKRMMIINAFPFAVPAQLESQPTVDSR